MEEYQEKEVEITEEEKEECCKPASLSTEGMIGSAILGAVGAMVLYYVYCNLSPDTKQVVRETIIKVAKKQLANLK